jgi:prevent-host-death family protein
MKAFKLTQDLIPLSEFKTHASKILNQIQRSKRSVVITQNGKAAGVLLHPEEFDRLYEQEDFLSALAEGLEDMRDGRTLSDSQLEQLVDSRFGNKKS